MNVVALISGGKDSCYSIMQCVSEGHTVVALANLRPKDKDELDSYMYQTVGHHAIDLYSEALNLPLYRHTIEGSSIDTNATYHKTTGDEVEDLFQLLCKVKEHHKIDAVCSGAILSDYQRVRVENVCERLGLKSLAYLWRRDQAELMREMIDCQLHSIIIKVAALGLEPKRHLGKSLADIYDHMIDMKDRYGLNICGEGGEFETFTLDCPLFNKKIVLDHSETVLHSDDAFAPVAYLNLKDMHLEAKSEQICSVSWRNRLASLPMKRGVDLFDELHVEKLQQTVNTPPINLFEDLERSLEDGDKPALASLQNADKYVSIRKLGNGYATISGIYALSSEDVSLQQSTEQAMQRLTDKLQALSCAASDVVAVYLYVNNMENFVNINQIYCRYFHVNPPIRICVQASLLDNVLLSLDCVVYHSSLYTEEQNSLTRRTMHVQSMSHWASANIGPYSQAVQVGDIIDIAGQIALQPADTTLVQSGIDGECVLSARHTTRVISAMCPQCDTTHCSLVICYVTHKRHFQNACLQYGKSFQNKECVSPLVVYVVVPGLPKGASVEWQVYSHIARCTDNIEPVEDFVDLVEGPLSASVNYIYSSGQPNLLSFAMHLESCRSSVQPLELVELAVKCLHNVLHSVEPSNCSPFTHPLRLFYKSELWPLPVVLEAISSVSSCSNLPSISCVPVINLTGDKCAVLCC